MTKSLTKSDLSEIITSLEYTKMRFESNTEYPSYEFKRNRIEEIEDIIRKVRELKKTL